MLWTTSMRRRNLAVKDVVDSLQRSRHFSALRWNAAAPRLLAM
jgi:hypothetical protein